MELDCDDVVRRLSSAQCDAPGLRSVSLPEMPAGLSGGVVMELQAIGAVADGKLTLQHPERFRLQLKQFNGRKVRVSVEIARKGRSSAQNRWFHGIIVRLCAEHTGYEEPEMKAILKGLFLKAEKDGYAYVRETHTLNTAEMAAFCDQCVRWAATTLGIAIPCPEDLGL